MTRFSSPDTLKFLTGQQITATVVNALTGPSYAWSTFSSQTPKVFTSYTHTQTLGKVDEHTDPDKAASSFSFFTAGPGTIIVKCDLILSLPEGSRWSEDEEPKFTAKSKPVTSVKPDWDSSKTAPTNGSVQILGSKMIFGNPPTNDGQDWREVELIVPAPFTNNGDGCFVQLITANRNHDRNVPPGSNAPTRIHYGRDKALDVQFPYPFSSGAWPLPSAGHFVDSPYVELAWNPNDGGGNDWFMPMRLTHSKRG